jgi:hypothetical protein
MRPLSRFLSVDWARRGLVLEALALLTLASAAVRVMPFRWYARSLGQVGHAPWRGASRGDDAALRVGWAIRAVSRALPWTCTCLMQAAAGQWMLRRRGIPATLELGMARDEATGAVLAHAWLSTGDVVLAGGAELSRTYTVVGRFTTGGVDRPH